MDREGSLANHTVVVRGNQIALVAPAASIDTTGATIVDAKGKWIVPGLADMHVHSWSERDVHEIEEPRNSRGETRIGEGAHRLTGLGWRALLYAR